MMFQRRLFLWSLSIALLLGSNGVVSQESIEVEEAARSSSSQRRELWDGFTLISYRTSPASLFVFVTLVLCSYLISILFCLQFFKCLAPITLVPQARWEMLAVQSKLLLHPTTPITMAITATVGTATTTVTPTATPKPTIVTIVTTANLPTPIPMLPTTITTPPQALRVLPRRNSIGGFCSLRVRSFRPWLPFTLVNERIL